MPEIYAKITPQGEVSLVEINSYEDLQYHVEGFITSVPVRTDKTIPAESTVYANDEGLLIGLAPNAVAQAVTGYPYLVGNVLIGGEVDDDGDTKNVNPDTVAKLHEASRRMSHGMELV